MKKLVYGAMFAVCAATFVMNAGDHVGDIESQTQNSAKIDNPRVTRIMEKIVGYDHNDQLKEVHEQLYAYLTHSTSYNEHQEKIQAMQGQQAIPVQADTLLSSVRLNDTALDLLEQHVDVLIAAENVKPARFIEKFGRWQGAMQYVRHLCVPTHYQQYVTAGVGSVAALVVFKNLEKSSPVQVNIIAPSSSTVSISNNNSTITNMATTMAILGAGAGMSVAGWQMYQSWMYKASSQEKIINLVNAVRTANLNFVQLFSQCNTAHNLVHLRQQVGQVDGRIVDLGENLSNLDGRVQEGFQATGRGLAGARADIAGVVQNIHHVGQRVEGVGSDVHGLAKQLKHTQQELLQDGDITRKLVDVKFDALGNQITGIDSRLDNMQAMTASSAQRESDRFTALQNQGQENAQVLQELLALQKSDKHAKLEAAQARNKARVQQWVQLSEDAK